MKSNLNGDFYGFEIRDLGEKDKEVGKTIDDFTKNVWIKFLK